MSVLLVWRIIGDESNLMSTIKISGGGVVQVDYGPNGIIYPDHDPFCIIYQLGPEHCNCSEDLIDEEEWDG